MIGQGPERTTEDRLKNWISIAEKCMNQENGFRLYPSDWAALKAVLEQSLTQIQKRS